MTPEEFDKALDEAECDAYVGIEFLPLEIVLDGWFTLPQLEVIVAYMKFNQPEG